MFFTLNTKIEKVKIQKEIYLQKFRFRLFGAQYIVMIQLGTYATGLKQYFYRTDKHMTINMQSFLILFFKTPKKIRLMKNLISPLRKRAESIGNPKKMFQINGTLAE